MPFLEFYSELFEYIKADETRLKIWGETLESQLEQVFMDQAHGDMTRWAEAFNNLPDIKGVSSELGQDVLTLQSAQADAEQD